MNLTSAHVDSIFTECLFRDGENASEIVTAEGITCVVNFNGARLNDHRADIESMLNELPDEFKKDSGGGWSFLNACNDKHGTQWTGLHSQMEKLFQLGIGIGKVHSLLPRDMWQALPGGMPYYIIV